MTELRVIGIDPGPTTGIAVLYFRDGRPAFTPHAIQCNAPVALELVASIIDNGDVWPRTLVQIERFVIGRSSQRAGQHGVVTRELIGLLSSCVLESVRCELHERSAVAVKPWATDFRLAKSGLLEPTKGMGHARDAARHALFTAVRDGGIPDPLSHQSGTHATERTQR